MGKVVAYGDEQLLYLGIDLYAINAMVNQDFEKIYKYPNRKPIVRHSV